MQIAVYRGAMTQRQHRHILIRQLVQQQRIPSQETLLTLLAEQGVTCTQATLSRDLRLLGIHREVDSEGPRYRLDGRRQYLAALRKVVGMEIISVHENGSMIVIRTLQGRAEGVAAFLDGRNDPDILGTVAGDDTLFIAPRSIAVIPSLVQRLQSLAVGQTVTNESLPVIENGL